MKVRNLSQWTRSDHATNQPSIGIMTLSGLTPYQYIFKIWTAEPERFIVNPIHQMPGLNT